MLIWAKRCQSLSSLLSKFLPFSPFLYPISINLVSEQVLDSKPTHIPNATESQAKGLKQWKKETPEFAVSKVRTYNLPALHIHQPQPTTFCVLNCCCVYGALPLLSGCWCCWVLHEVACWSPLRPESKGNMWFLAKQIRPTLVFVKSLPWF